MEGVSILLLIFSFIILVAVIVIAILYFTYVNKYDESNIFYKNLLEIIKKDTTVDSALTKSDFKIADLDEDNSKLSNILDYPNTISDNIGQEVDDIFSSKLSTVFDTQFDSKFDSNLNAALKNTPSGLEGNEETTWDNIIGFDYTKAKTYNEIIAKGAATEFLYDLHHPAENVEIADATKYHRTINNAANLLGDNDPTISQFESIEPKHIKLLNNAQLGYEASGSKPVQDADIPIQGDTGRQEALLKNAFYYITNNDLQKTISDINTDLTAKQANISISKSQLKTNADSTVAASRIDGTSLAGFKKTIIDTSKVIFCPTNNDCYSLRSDGAFVPVALTT